MPTKRSKCAARSARRRRNFDGCRPADGNGGADGRIPACAPGCTNRSDGCSQAPLRSRAIGLSMPVFRPKWQEPTPRSTPTGHYPSRECRAKRKGSLNAPAYFPNQRLRSAPMRPLTRSSRERFAPGVSGCPAEATKVSMGICGFSMAAGWQGCSPAKRTIFVRKA